MSAIWNVVVVSGSNRAGGYCHERVHYYREQYCRLTELMAGRETCSGSSVEIYDCWRNLHRYVRIDSKRVLSEIKRRPYVCDFSDQSGGSTRDA